MTTTTDPWDDARLSAAYAAMSTTVQAPADLLARTMAAVRATAADAGRRPGRWARLVPAAAALGTVAASVAIAVVLTGGLNTVDPAGSTAPSPTARSSSAAGLRVADLPRLSVEDLLARIDARPTADEVIVHGWLGRTSAVVDCEHVSKPHPLMPYCEEFGLFLMQDEADPDAGGPGLEGPAVPFVLPMLRFDAHVDANPLPGQAVEVLAVGHLLDHRWTSCPPAAAQECRERFVIDRIIPADHAIAEAPEPWLHDAEPHAVPAEVVPAIEAAVGEIAVVSIGALPTDSIALIEPEADLLIEQEGTELVWVVRALTTGPTQTEATTYLVPAAPLRTGNALVYRITAAGPEALSIAAAPAPTQVHDLDVLSVTAAIDIRDAGVDDREIAVRGWFSPIQPMSCPFTPATSPVQPVCPDQYIVLMEQPESLVTVEDNGFSGRVPVGPSIQIDLDGLETGWQPGLPDRGPSKPVEIVVIGHFDDRRSTACPADVERACRGRLVVDRVDWVDGESMPLSVQNPLDGQTVSTLDQVEAIVANEAPASPVLSIVVADGPTGIGRIEPTLQDGAGGLTAKPAIWIARVLESERISTYLVIDDSDDIYELGVDGEPIHVGGSEEPATFSIPLTNVPDRPVTIDVVDRTGILEDAREATPDQVSRPWGPATDRVRIENLAPDTVLMRWTDTVCARRPRLTIDPDPIPGGRHHGLHLSDMRPTCDAMAIGRGIVLRFNVDLDADDLVVTEEIEIIDP